jgi:hypothetical protein
MTSKTFIMDPSFSIQVKPKNAYNFTRDNPNRQQKKLQFGINKPPKTRKPVIRKACLIVEGTAAIQHAKLFKIIFLFDNYLTSAIIHAGRVGLSRHRSRSDGGSSGQD